MKRVALAFMLSLIVTVAVAGTAMAVGPSTNGYGADPTGDHPPNDVYVPSAAYDHSGPTPPGNPDSNGALFYEVPPSDGD